ncbi:hypothetical protein M8C21_000497 [Ambrosia artemisiifolia]|uniref:Uncharacterized protein n=1 Tax=Ambrosia artemisiifolia TaxID=4212 RepID=A0AAD5CFY0_AMBAR|nr:hypothetical protein M8C21_000497 [Ambrosia artemisiifolia]
MCSFIYLVGKSTRVHKRSIFISMYHLSIGFQSS